MQVEFVTPTPEHITHLAAHMREQDVEEVNAAGSYDLLAVVADGVKQSAMCWAAVADGELACIFGVVSAGSMLNPVGVPWLLGTDMIPRHGRIFARLSKPYIERMLDAYPILTNAVHTKNTVAIRWLKHTGFELQAPRPCPASGELFQVFTLRKKPCASL